MKTNLLKYFESFKTRRTFAKIQVLLDTTTYVSGAGHNQRANAEAKIHKLLLDAKMKGGL